MSNAFMSRIVTGESFVIKTSELAVALTKVSPDQIKGLNMAEGGRRFNLPRNIGSFGDVDINAKVRNPFLSLHGKRITLP